MRSVFGKLLLEWHFKAETEGMEMSEGTMTLGAALRQAREHVKISFQELSEETGIPVTSLHNLFQDRVKSPSMARIALVADALGQPRGPLMALAGFPGDAAPDVVEEAITRLRRTARDLPADTIGELMGKVLDVLNEFDSHRRIADGQTRAGLAARAGEK